MVLRDVDGLAQKTVGWDGRDEVPRCTEGMRSRIPEIDGLSGEHDEVEGTGLVAQHTVSVRVRGGQPLFARRAGRTERVGVPIVRHDAVVVVLLGVVPYVQ